MLDEHALQTTQRNGKFWQVDPMEVYPDRDFIVIVGSGDIVDAVGDRDDFLAGVVSRRYVLRRKGLDLVEIERVEAEIQSQEEAKSSIVMQEQENQARLQQEQAIAVARVQASVRPTGTQSASSQRRA